MKKLWLISLLFPTMSCSLLAQRVPAGETTGAGPVQSPYVINDNGYGYTGTVTGAYPSQDVYGYKPQVRAMSKRIKVHRTGKDKPVLPRNKVTRKKGTLRYTISRD